MNLVIKALSPEIIEDYFDFFDNRAFSDGSPFYPCYCNAFNLSQTQIKDGLYAQVEAYGGGIEGWKRTLRESAYQMVKDGIIKGYLAYDDGASIGWCNANDRLSYYRVGEFDLGNVPEDLAPFDCPQRGMIKSVVCFEVAPEYRGMRIATKLLERVCADAANDGYSYVEAYPVEQIQNNTLAFTGPIHLFEKAGFSEYARNGSKIIMRKSLRKDDERKEKCGCILRDIKKSC